MGDLEKEYGYQPAIPLEIFERVKINVSNLIKKRTGGQAPSNRPFNAQRRNYTSVYDNQSYGAFSQSNASSFRGGQSQGGFRGGYRGGNQQGGFRKFTPGFRGGRGGGFRGGFRGGNQSQRSGDQFSDNGSQFSGFNQNNNRGGFNNNQYKSKFDTNNEGGSQIGTMSQNPIV